MMKGRWLPIFRSQILILSVVCVTVVLVIDN